MGTTIDEYPKDMPANPRPDKCCKICRHFCPYVYEFDADEPQDQLVSNYGECRRYPPKAISEEESIFPVVEETRWCGEFDI